MCLPEFLKEVTGMAENKVQKYDMRASDYFNSLPPYVRETLVQSAALIESDDDLINAADKIMGEI